VAESAVSDAAVNPERIAQLTDQINQQKAAIAQHQAELNKWVGTTAQVDASQYAAATAIASETRRLPSWNNSCNSYWLPSGQPARTRRIRRCQQRSSVMIGNNTASIFRTNDLREPRRQGETRRTVDLGHSSDGPSWIDLAENRVNTTESRFADCLNRLLQQNLPIRDISARPGSGILSAASQTGPQQPGARSLPCPLMTVGS
jgi:hypothetical protein